MSQTPGVYVPSGGTQGSPGPRIPLHLHEILKFTAQKARPIGSLTEWRVAWESEAGRWDVQRLCSGHAVCRSYTYVSQHTCSFVGMQHFPPQVYASVDESEAVRVGGAGRGVGEHRRDAPASSWRLSALGPRTADNNGSRRFRPYRSPANDARAATTPVCRDCVHSWRWLQNGTSAALLKRYVCLIFAVCIRLDRAHSTHARRDGARQERALPDRAPRTSCPPRALPGPSRIDVSA